MGDMGGMGGMGGEFLERMHVRAVRGSLRCGHEPERGMMRTHAYACWRL